jgi:hypothetical protein
LGLVALWFSGTAQITSFPYSEDFEGGAAGWTPSGTLWQNGIPTTLEMSEANTDCINNVFATNLTGDYTNGANETVTSPQFDFTALTSDPIVQFDIFRNNESCCDELWLEYTIDNGATWQKVVNPLVNWYNDAGNQWWDNDTPSGFEIASATLTGAAGIANVQVRFVFTSDGSVTYEGMAFDNVTIGEPTFTELEFVEVLSPTSGPSLGSNIPVTVVVRNNGPATVDFSEYAICYQGDVPQTCASTITNIPGYTMDTLTVLGTMDLSTIGNTYSIQFYLSQTSLDFNQCNDTLNVDITNIQPVSSFPYLEDFENGNGEWTSTGTIWEHGIPTTTNFVNANTACHNNLIVSNLGGNYPNNAFETILSPFFDFSSFTADPIIKFDMMRDFESCCDEIWFEYTLDNGSTWQKVVGPGTNWYNDLGNEWWDSSTTNWTLTEAPLTGLAGEANVRFRFVLASDASITREGAGIDNIYVGDPSYTDLQLVEIITPVGGALCRALPSSDSIQVVITLCRFLMALIRHSFITVKDGILKR